MRREITQPYRVFLLDSEEHYDELIAVLTAAIARDRENAVAIGNRGLAYCEIGCCDEALKDFGLAIQLDPRLSIVWMNRADLLRRMRRYEEALRDYSAAIERQPRDPCYRRSRAHLLHELGRFNEACQDYDVAITIEPGFKCTLEARDLARRGEPLPRVSVQ